MCTMCYARYMFIVLLMGYMNFHFYVTIMPNMLQKVVYWGFPLLYVLFRYKDVLHIWKDIRNKQYILYGLFMFMLAFVWSFFVIVINDSSDWSYFHILETVIHYILISIAFYLLLSDYNKRNTFYMYCVTYIATIFLCVICTLFFLENFDLRFVWQSMIVASDYQVGAYDMAQNITRFSFPGMMAFGETIKCSIGVVFSCILLSRGYLIGFLGLFLSAIGNLFYGRIGIALSLICVIILLSEKISIKFVTAICLTLLLLIFILSSIESPELMYWLEWLYNPVESFFYGLSVGQFSLGSSGDVLVERMYFMPEDITFVCGDGQYTDVNGGHYMATDAGYMRIVLFGGLPLAFLVYGAFLLLSFAAYKNLGTNNKFMQKVVLVLVIMFFISEYKGDAYFIFFGAITLLNIISCKER